MGSCGGGCSCCRTLFDEAVRSSPDRALAHRSVCCEAHERRATPALATSPARAGSRSALVAGVAGAGTETTREPGLMPPRRSSLPTGCRKGSTRRGWWQYRQSWLPPRGVKPTPPLWRRLDPQNHSPSSSSEHRSAWPPGDPRSTMLAHPRRPHRDARWRLVDIRDLRAMDASGRTP